MRLTSLAKLVCIGAAVTMSGCSLLGQKVTVPTAHVGKILTKKGFKDETISPSRFRLDPCFTFCDSLVVLQVSDLAYNENFELFMPEDQLNMRFDVRMTLSINMSKIDEIYKKVSAQRNGISVQTVYDIYAKQVLRSTIREVMAEYTIAEIASSREAISGKLSDAIIKSLKEKDTPFLVKHVGLADVQYPDVITKAKENAAERRELVEKERAQFEIQKVTMERELEEAKMKRAIEREKAEMTTEVNELLSKSVTDKYLQYRTLEVLEKMADSENKVFMPVEALSSVGAQVSMFADKQSTLTASSTKGGQ